MSRHQKVKYYVKKQIIRFLKWLLPSYAIAPLVVNLFVNFLGYNAIGAARGMLSFYDFSIGLDKEIPMMPVFMYVYIGAFVQWVVGFVTCVREDKEFCYRFMSAELCAKILALICFLLIPSTIARPEISGGSAADVLTRFVYSIDAPVNLFPSIHVLESWFCLRAAFRQKKTGKIYPWVTGIMTVLVAASVVLVKQHVCVDIIGGIAVFEIGMLMTRKFSFAGLYRKVTDIFMNIAGRAAKES